MALRQHFLTDWLFACGETEACLSSGTAVQLPHTWSVREDSQHYTGKGWYRTSLPADTFSAGERVFLRFRGVYRDCDLFVNDCPAFRHAGSGYTPFTVEITDMLHTDSENTITVCADNRFSTHALPYDKSFDWANDGGLYRPAEIWITGPSAVGETQITSSPVILSYGCRQHRGPALFGFRAMISRAVPASNLRWALFRGAENSITPVEPEPVLSGTLPCAEETVLSPILLSDIAYWHFDQPELYTLRLSLLLPDGRISDLREWCIGFRELKAQGTRLLLNGEPVRLPGTEWMPGSDPDIGAAESREDLERMLLVLRQSNSVLTRFHWQQDDWVYDWCDRHGLLVQEEIPFWGKQPEGDPEVLWPVIRQQMLEMTAAHRHHPSIFAWGVGNELSAQTWPVQQYIRKAVACFHELDDSRPANYVSNTAFACPHQDGTGDGDILMINDYIGTWHQGFDQETAWQALLEAHPGRIFIPSEFGLCEPAFSGGDPRREEIFLEKLACYRRIPAIAGTIYFCLNDYRTHMGEEGEGRMKRRVHGSADLAGCPKPSYFTVQREYAPLRAEHMADGLLISCRDDIPCYTVSGYILRNGTETVALPDLKPGETWLWKGTPEKSFCILRPTGEPMLPPDI